jgi:Tfp pilus assembly major pilin PilA
MRRRQQGMTFIGLLFVLAMAGAIVYAGIRITPLYLNYMKVARSLDATAGDYKGSDGVDQAALRRTLEKHWQIEDISSVDAKDVEITKDGSITTLHVAYDDSSPYVANLSLSMHFDKSVSIK